MLIIVYFSLWVYFVLHVLLFLAALLVNKA